MKRMLRVAMDGIATVLVLAFFLLAPIIPIGVPIVELQVQHGECVGTSISQPPTQIHASLSYALFSHGAVYVAQGGYLWWLPQPGSSTSLVCI